MRVFYYFSIIQKKSMKILLLFLISSFFFACRPADVKSIESRQDDLIENAYNVGFLIMDGVYNTELTAPYDIFHHTRFRDGIKPMNVFTIADNTEWVKSFEGLTIKPDYSYIERNHPKIDILVVPSAEHHLDSDLENEVMIAWVKTITETAEFVTSHCDGAFVLAKAGVLDQSACTTFPSDINKFKQMFPHLDVRDSTLFVHDGKYITSAGGAKSFEAALYLCELLYGKKVAESLAGGLVIDWNLNQVPHTVIE
jgi:transcriptional regulator GlxA family with amidase domain